MSTQMPARTPRATGRQLAPRTRPGDPLGEQLLARALQFSNAIVTEAGEILVKGMRGELPGSDAKEQRLCATAIRAERVPSASATPAGQAPRVTVTLSLGEIQQPRRVGANVEQPPTLKVDTSGRSLNGDMPNHTET